jgi:hypothetical protein
MGRVRESWVLSYKIFKGLYIYVGFEILTVVFM